MAKQEDITDVHTDTFKLKQGYRLHVAAIDINDNKTWMQLTRANGDLVDECIVNNDECFSLYDDGTLIIDTGNITLGRGLVDNLVIIDDLVQYNKNTGNPILTVDKVILVCPTQTLPENIVLE